MNRNIFASLPNGLGARAQALVDAREEQGLNVHFVNAEGVADRMSFSTIERANAFRAKRA